MDVVGRKVENQVHFWSLLGPFFVLLSIAVLLFKISPHWYFPASALIGLPLCVKWKMKGMAISLGCLFLLSGFSFQYLELDDRYWHVGLSLAMAFSFIVLTLSLEEVQGLVGKLQLESQSRLDNFLLLDDKWKNAELAWSVEKEKVKSEVDGLTHDLAKVQEDKQIFYKLAQLAKDELIQVRSQHDLLLQDLIYKKQQISQLQERLEETELTIQGFVNSDVEQHIQTLTESIGCLEREKETFQAKIDLAHKECLAYQVEKEHLCQELQACHEREKLSVAEQHRYHQDNQEQQNVLLSLQSKCQSMEQEIERLEQAQTQWQEQSESFNQLKIQHQHTIEQLHHKIHDLETNLIKTGKEKEVFQAARKELEQQLLHHEQQAKQKEEQEKACLQQLQDRFDEEKRKIETQFKQGQQQALQQSQQEMRVLQERYHQNHETLLKLKEDLEATQQALSQTRKKESEYKADFERMQQELAASKKIELQLAQSYEEKEKALVQEMLLLQESGESIKQEFIRAQHELEAKSHALEAKNDALDLMQKKMQQLSNEMGEQQSLSKHSVEQTEALEALKLELELALQQTQEELQQAKQKIEQNETLEMLKSQLEQTLQQTQEELLQAKQKIEDNGALRALKSQLEQALQQTQEELLQAKQKVEQNETLEALKTQLEQTLQQAQEELLQAKQKIEQNEMLTALKSQLEHTLQQTQEELQLAKQKIEEKKQRQEKECVQVLSSSGNTRGVDSMYKQLKTQFKEKCDVLDATRRELFYANEELLKHQKEYEEEHLYNQSVNERHMQRHVIRLGKQFEQMQANYQQEIDDLTQLVGQLLQQAK